MNPIPTTMPVPDWLHELIEEVTALRAEFTGRAVTHEQTIRIAMDAGLREQRDNPRFIQKQLGDAKQAS